MDEKLRILKMVEDGTITAQQGAELMSTMNIDMPPLQNTFEKSSYDKKCFALS